MAQLSLAPEEREALTDLVAHTHDATILRRAQALLWLDGSERVVEVAQRLGVSRQVIYQWIARFHHNPPTDLATRLAVGIRSGRPCMVKGVIDPFIDEVIDHDPRTLGYHSTVWTAPLLVYYLEDQHGLKTSISSVRRTVARLGLKWKRPRHRLALRPATWRQSKGGLKRGWRRAGAP